MFLGHHAIAFAAKRAAPATSLGTLFFAAQFLDELWPVLLLAGVERVSIVPGLMAASSIDFIHYPYSHSLLMALVWAALAALGFFCMRRGNTRGAVVVGALVASHWLLDAPMHRPDLPLWPGSVQMVGLGLWNSVALTLVIEFGLLAVGIALYASGTRTRDRTGRWALVSLVAMLAVAFLGSFAGTPPDGDALAFGALLLWLFVPWAWWADSHRIPNGPDSAARPS